MLYINYINHAMCVCMCVWGGGGVSVHSILSKSVSPRGDPWAIVSVQLAKDGLLCFWINVLFEFRVPVDGTTQFSPIKSVLLQRLCTPLGMVMQVRSEQSKSKNHQCGLCHPSWNIRTLLALTN